MYYKDNLTKVSFHCYDKTASWETPFNDVDIQDIIQGFVGCLCSVCWDEEIVIDSLKQYLDDHNKLTDE